MFVEPYQMEQPVRGAQTTETQIEIFWTAITADTAETGGSEIIAYNLQWKV